jgi:hypothetical protein
VVVGGGEIMSANDTSRLIPPNGFSCQFRTLNEAVVTASKLHGKEAAGVLARLLHEASRQPGHLKRVDVLYSISRRREHR